MKLFGDDWLSLRYVQRYPESARIDKWASHPVHIQTENGIWRPGGHGYTMRKSDAGIWDFGDAVRTTSHCGPEKRVRYLRATQGSD